MMGVREHIDRLNAGYLIVRTQQFDVAGLRCRIAANVNNFLWGTIQNSIYHIGVHTGAGWVGNNNVGFAMLINKRLI